MDFVDIELAGQIYKLRYTADDVQDICRRLTTFQPSGDGKVTPVKLGRMLLDLDIDTFQFCLWAGMRHIAKYKDVDPSDAMKLLKVSIERGAQWTDLRRPILRALVACGLNDFAPIIKILDNAEAQRDQDGAIDTTSEEDADSGNDGGSSARMKNLTMPLPTGGSASLTSTSGYEKPDQ